MPLPPVPTFVLAAVTSRRARWSRRAGARLSAAQIGGLAAAGLPAVRCGAASARLRSDDRNRAPRARRAARAWGGLRGQRRDAGGTARLGGRRRSRCCPAVADDEGAHRRALERGLEADVLVTSGGVSVGPHDLVRRIEAELGVREVFWGVAVKPGKPLSFGVREGTLVFGLPGNPVSSLVGFELFVRPAVLALQGAADPRPRFETGTLAAAVRRNARTRRVSTWKSATGRGRRCPSRAAERAGIAHDRARGLGGRASCTFRAGTGSSRQVRTCGSSC